MGRSKNRPKRKEEYSPTRSKISLGISTSTISG